MYVHQILTNTIQTMELHVYHNVLKVTFQMTLNRYVKSKVLTESLKKFLKYLKLD